MKSSFSGELAVPSTRPAPRILTILDGEASSPAHRAPRISETGSPSWSVSLVMVTFAVDVGCIGLPFLEHGLRGAIDHANVFRIQDEVAVAPFGIQRASSTRVSPVLRFGHSG